MSKTVMQSSQETLILNHLKATKSISGVEASAIFKVRSLPRRIATLRERGYRIKSNHCTDSQGQRYVRYTYCKYQPLESVQLEINFNA